MLLELRGAEGAHVLCGLPGESAPAAGIQTDSVLSARLQIIRIYIREDGRLVIEFKTQAKFRGEVVPREGEASVQIQTRSEHPGGRTSPSVLRGLSLCSLSPRLLVPTPGLFVMEHHSLPDVRSFLMTPDHLGGIEFDLQLLWSAQTFDSPYQLWRATSSYNR